MLCSLKVLLGTVFCYDIDTLADSAWGSDYLFDSINEFVLGFFFFELLPDFYYLEEGNEGSFLPDYFGLCI